MPEPLSPGARVFQGMLRRPFEDIAVALVVPDGQPAFLYIDANQNSALEAVERISFRPSEERPELEGIALVRLATNCGRYEEMPVELRLLKPRSGPSPERRVLAHSGFWSVRGQVRVDDRDILVEYPYPCDTGTVDLANGPFGMDADGNGSIDWHPNSPENASAMNETIVFRVGNHYLSTATVDVSTGRVVFRSHPAADYRRIELTVGSQVLDFSYTDFEGREHRLSDLGERYVLLDFWFAACGQCIAGIPNLKEARERYQSRGFEVLSLTNDDEEELDAARRVVADKDVDWPQAAGPRVRDLVNQRFRIRSYPNYVLLGITFPLAPPKSRFEQ